MTSVVQTGLQISTARLPSLKSGKRLPRLHVRCDIACGIGEHFENKIYQIRERADTARDPDSNKPCKQAIFNGCGPAFGVGQL